MKAIYETPQIEVIEIQIEDAILSNSPSTNSAGTENVRSGLILGD